MAAILPFRGLRYNPEKIEDISKVTTPPYDVISEKERERFYGLHPNSIIRLILGKDLPGDTQSVNKYTRAAGFFEEWRKEQVLIQDSEPAIYVYAQQFTLENRRYTRRGFVSLVKLEDFKTGNIYPHEHTLSKPKEDRMKLMQSCDANFSQVFAFYEDREKKMSDILFNATGGDTEIGASADVDFVDVYGVRNLLWVINDGEVIQQITTLMKDKALFIADGHHRYETALYYRDVNRDNAEMQKRIKQSSTDDTIGSPLDYLMMMSVAMEDQGLQILPTHRLVRNIGKLDPDKIKKSLKEVFQIENLGKGCDVAVLTKRLREERESHSFILYIGEEDKGFYLLTVRDKERLHQILEEKHAPWKSLDTGILHGFIFEKILGIKTEDIAKTDCLKYIQSESESIAAVNEGKHQLAFFLNPTRIEQIRDIAIERNKMPPKATYFYPKLITGIVLRHMIEI
ncbi:MAG: DUF1015 domain-containing protein [Candidatus Scalindua sp. AMX11]|nr:MAG: DUF1015 domain-containing protein [Candidatus Scalindua sp.]NOG82301.1 DUF1015 domain-containing protein [Planctomycetota bacterium]RZV66661.1 MAG: DUF1015 domain-containing protein [Candidatus Scalindua sp. SCAELEC01]TDE63638.1 MAG: DUF1015 domain-containing protein [Candidatus Scalindua sp. AMX11]GJQ60005.1 MAG: phosphatase [Candidatus Scalindua sp.]